MTKKIWFQTLPLVFLAAAIAFSPEFGLGTIGEGRDVVIRIEDVLLIIFGLVWITNFLISGRSRIEKPPLFFLILAWLGISFFGILTNWILGNIEISRGFFYFLKEIEFFFIYFYVFYHIKNIDSAKFIINFWIVLGVIAILLILFQFSQDTRYGSYGPSLFMEKGPLPSSGFFLILFASLFNVFLYYYSRLNISKIKKIILAIFILSLPIGVIASGSRTAILGLIPAVFFTFLFYQIKRGGLKPLFISLIIFIVIGGIFFVVSEKIPRILGLELKPAIGALSVRAGIWEVQFKLMSDNPFNVLFGLGKSVLLVGEESHSQYVRNFIETGIIGSLIFLALIFAIIKKSGQFLFRSKDPLLVGLSSGVFISTLIMLFLSIAAEAFMVVRIVEVYWFFMGLTMAVLYLSEKKIPYKKETVL